MIAVKEKQHFALLNGSQYMNLTTFRKNGTEVTRPVWFAQDGDKIYMVTHVPSGKVTHIRRNPDVFVSPCDPMGKPKGDERAAGTATVIDGEDDPVAVHAEKVLNKKYGLIKRLIELTHAFRPETPAWIVIEPR